MLETQALKLVGLITTHHTKLEELKATAQKVKATEEKYQSFLRNPLSLPEHEKAVKDGNALIMNHYSQTFKVIKEAITSIQTFQEAMDDHLASLAKYDKLPYLFNTIKIAGQRFIDHYNLAHGNSEVDVCDDGVIIVVEAPRHTVLSLDMRDDFELFEALLNEKDKQEQVSLIHNRIKELFIEAVNDFDVDDEFNELWSSGFSSRNGFSAREFIDLLSNDQTFFEEVAQIFKKENHRA